jgi:dihydroorotate dehydrogenase electron transfer subunit
MLTKILENHEVSPQYFKMSLLCPDITKKGQAGQFIMLRMNEKYDPLLPRAFALHRINPKPTLPSGTVEILYQIAGRVTRFMSLMKPDEELSVIGPFGNGFEISGSMKRAVIIAGGIGVAPTYLLAEKLAEENIKTSLLIGGKSRDSVLCVDEFLSLGIETKIATEDGTLGEKGTATELLLHFIEEHEKKTLKDTALFACGPYGMLKNIARIAKDFSLPCQVSMEAKMACGIGVCLGCVVKAKKTNEKDGFAYDRVCKEGPVFKSEEIVWE